VVVVEKGVDVNNFEIGDEVYSRVPQEQMGTDNRFVLVAKTKISFEEAAGLPLTGLTAIQALESVGIKDGFLFMQALGVGRFNCIKAKGAIVYTTTSSKM
jgi:NADPH:quinone reductase-like Zn-dependent oxidoreductase